MSQEADLPADRPYLFGYHPHGKHTMVDEWTNGSGIIGMYVFDINGSMLTCRGAFATFATEGTGFSKLFPGILPHLLTLGEPQRFAHYRH